jgi:hypothetical protein
MEFTEAFARNESEEKLDEDQLRALQGKSWHQINPSLGQNKPGYRLPVYSTSILNLFCFSAARARMWREIATHCSARR